MSVAQATTTDEAMIQKALDEAQAAIDRGEVGVGAVLYWRGEILGIDHNRYEETGDVTAHAEMSLLRSTALRLKQMSDEEKADLTLYSTLEPCLMCFSAMSYAGIKRTVYAALIEDADQESMVARGLTCGEINPLLTKGAMELVEGVKREGGKRLLAEMGHQD